MRWVSSRRWRRLRDYLTEHPYRGAALAALIVVVVPIALPRLVPRGGAEALPLEAPATRRSELDAAFAAAFGPHDYALRRIGEDEELTRLTPGLLVETSFGPVLISEGRVISPRAASRGKLAITYLERASTGYRLSRSFLPAIEGGALGELPGWRVRGGGPFPVIEVPGDCAIAEQVELRPGGPVLRHPELVSASIFVKGTLRLQNGC